MSDRAPLTMHVPMVRRLTLLACAALAVVAAGCGGSEPQLQPLRSLTGVAKASQTAGTGRFELSMQQTMPGMSQAFRFSARGAFDLPAKRMQMQLDMSALAQVFGAFGSALGGSSNDPKAKALLDPANWKIDAVLDGFVMYMRMPFLGQQLPSGKSWVRMDLRQAAAAKGVDLGQLDSYVRSDPRQTLDYLRAVAGKIVPMGREDVRGTETTRYRAMLDLAKYGRMVPARQQQAFGDFYKAATQLGLTLVPVNVWVDDDGLLRRMDMELTLTPTAGKAAKSSLRFEMFDYGQPVSIEAPPAEQTVDASSLRG
ncbi:MAG TPA: hypothetical protein VJ689_04545 [Gaiellaceae bacterium]|jgi:hypothetical protein|nr:hypothetical protein [Gaiellaceae bacterium]